MKRPISLGYPTVPDGIVHMGPWVVTPSAQNTLEAPDVVPDWDYLQGLAISRTLQVDPTALLSACGLRDATVAAALTWHCTATNLRGAGEPVTVDPEPQTISLTLDGADLGGRLALETQLILIRPDSVNRPFTARRPGSVLWRESTSLTLEGQGPRFPLLPVSFAQSGIAEGRTGAWALLWATHELSASGAGSVQLALNTDHPAIRALLDDPRSPAQRQLGQIIMYDTARQMITFALTRDDLLDGLVFDDGTLGRLLTDLITTVFPHRSLQQLRGDMETSPGELESEMQAAMRLLQTPS